MEQLLIMVPEDTATRWCDGTNTKCTTVFGEDTSTTLVPTGDCGETGKIGEEHQFEVDDNDGNLLFIISFIIDCNERTATVNLTYPNHDGGWFGIVFNDDTSASNRMKGNALIYTTGKEGDRDIGLYSYILEGPKSISSVVYHPQLNWQNVETTSRRLQSANGLNIVYETSLSNTDNFDVATDEVTFSWALGSDDALNDIHYAFSNVAVTLNLEEGIVTTEEDDKTIEYIHASCMFAAWAVLCPIGIISAAFRWLYKGKSEGTWFAVHRGIQVTVLVLTLAGFGIALYMVIDAESPHFDVLHEQLGLAVVCVVVFQVLFALIRPKPIPKGEKKKGFRLIWEIIHKLCGYGDWILSQVVIYLGVELVGSPEIYKYLVLGWSGLIVIVYLILWSVTFFRTRSGNTEEELKRLLMHLLK